MAAPARADFLGTWVDAMTIETFVEAVADRVTAPGRSLVVNHNMQSLTLHHRDAEFRACYARSDLVFIDGMPVVALARMFGCTGVRREHRIGVLDWLVPLLERAAREGWRVAHVGSEPAVIQVARRRLLEQVPTLDLVTIPGYFDQSPGSAESIEVLTQLRTAAPAIVLVGMGMPRQEHWVLHHLEQLPPAVVITVGGILGFWGGDRPTAPRWLGQVGLEWAYRLVTEWRRLWRRYLLEPWILVPAIITELRTQRSSRR